MKLKDIVDGSVLRQAVALTMQRNPYFRVRLVMDHDRICFEDNPAPVPVLHTDRRIVLGSEQTQSHLIAFCYWKNRLCIDCCHGLTDGGGIAPLISTLLYYYCSQYYGTPLSSEGIRLADSPVLPQEWEDPARIPIRDIKPLVAKWNQPDFAIETGSIVHVTPESDVYNIRISEEAFMRFNLSND